MRECPVQHAKKDIFIRFTTKDQRSLYDVQIHCSQKLEGCEWKGELGQLDNHLNLSPQAKLVNSWRGVGTLKLSVHGSMVDVL